MSYIPSTWRRLVARGIDAAISTVFYVPFGKMFFLLVFTDEDVRISLAELVLMFMIPAIYEMIFLLFMQRTPGKWFMGLTVVPDDDYGRTLNWYQCILRPLTSRFSFFFSWAIYALAFFRYDRTHLSDWVAGTRVVQNHPRLSRPKKRWFLGAFLLVLYSYEGLVASSRVLQLIDWRSSQVELRQLMDFEDVQELEFDF